MAKLERLREVNLKISDSRGLTEAQVKALVDAHTGQVVRSVEAAEYDSEHTKRFRRY